MTSFELVGEGATPSAGAKEVPSESATELVLKTSEPDGLGGSTPSTSAFRPDGEREIILASNEGFRVQILVGVVQECAPGRAGGLQSLSTQFESERSCLLPAWLDFRKAAVP